MTTTSYHVTYDGVLFMPNDGGALAAERHADWERLVDAGLIGNTPPMSAEVRANLEATDALFRTIARDRRRLKRGW